MKKALSNQEYWLEIENLPAFEDSDTCWKWLEKLQQTRMTQQQIICLKGLVEAVYNAAIEKDK
jgi:hypothetical protein